MVMLMTLPKRDRAETYGKILSLLKDIGNEEEEVLEHANDSNPTMLDVIKVFTERERERKREREREKERSHSFIVLDYI